MKTEILAFGIILLFLGLAVSPSIYADNSKVSLEPTPEFDYDGYTPIQLVFLLINKLHNYVSVDEAEINSIIEELESYSCDCEDDYKPELFERRWFFVCTFLVPIWAFTQLITVTTGAITWERIVFAISEVFNCGF